MYNSLNMTDPILSPAAYMVHPSVSRNNFWAQRQSQVMGASRFDPQTNIFLMLLHLDIWVWLSLSPPCQQWGRCFLVVVGWHIKEYMKKDVISGVSPGWRTLASKWCISMQVHPWGTLKVFKTWVQLGKMVLWVRHLSCKQLTWAQSLAPFVVSWASQRDPWEQKHGSTLSTASCLVAWVYIGVICT